MKSRQIAENGVKQWILVFENGDEFMEGMSRFAKDNHLTASSFTGIGALQDVVLGYFDWNTKDYKKLPVGEQVEVLSLAGDIALDNEKPAVHAHIVVGKSDGTAHGGHLMEARVRPTLEVILTETPAHLRKQYDPESGLALIKP